MGCVRVARIKKFTCAAQPFIFVYVYARRPTSSLSATCNTYSHDCAETRAMISVGQASDVAQRSYRSQPAAAQMSKSVGAKPHRPPTVIGARHCRQDHPSPHPGPSAGASGVNAFVGSVWCKSAPIESSSLSRKMSARCTTLNAAPLLGARRETCIHVTMNSTGCAHSK